MTGTKSEVSLKNLDTEVKRPSADALPNLDHVGVVKFVDRTLKL